MRKGRRLLRLLCVLSSLGEGGRAHWWGVSVERRNEELCSARGNKVRLIIFLFHTYTESNARHTSDVDSPISPCGICRQVIREFCALNMPIYLVPSSYDVDKGKADDGKEEESDEDVPLVKTMKV